MPSLVLENLNSVADVEFQPIGYAKPILPSNSMHIISASKYKSVEQFRKHL